MHARPQAQSTPLQWGGSLEECRETAALEWWGRAIMSLTIGRGMRQFLNNFNKKGSDKTKQTVPLGGFCVMEGLEAPSYDYVCVPRLRCVHVGTMPYALSPASQHRSSNLLMLITHSFPGVGRKLVRCARL